MVMGAQNGFASGKVNSLEPGVTRIARRDAKSTLLRNNWAVCIPKKAPMGHFADRIYVQPATVWRGDDRISEIN
jgi:hypothetical protein